MRFHLISAFLLIFLLTVTFSACERSDRPRPRTQAKGNVHVGGTLRVSLTAPVSELRPTAMKDRNATMVGIHLHEGLLRADPVTAELIPGIAEAWNATRNGSEYVFNLNSRAVFHPSERFAHRSRGITAKDVIYSFELLAREADDDLFRATLGGRLQGAEEFRKAEADHITGLTAIDDYTLAIRITRPDPSFLHVLTLPALGIVPAALGDEKDEQIPIGAGPFRFASNEEDLVLVRNPDYHHGDAFGNQYPYIDTLVFKVIPQRTAELEAFFEGRIDLVSGLELDPVRDIIEQHIRDFSGKDPEYILKRETENASYETYLLYRAGIRNIGTGFMGYRDFSRVQIEQ